MPKNFLYQHLVSFTENIFLKIGCSMPDAETAARSLLAADLQGVDSHGVARLSGYVRLWEVKRVNATPSIKTIRETPSTATIDGDAGLGLVIAPHAMEVAIEKAKQVGTGWVSVKNSNHFGIAGAHAMMALPHDMIGIAMTNARALVAPTFSIERMLGTNPIAVAVPAGNEPAFVADFATTTPPMASLRYFSEKMHQCRGMGADKIGEPSTDPHELKEGGALFPSAAIGNMAAIKDMHWVLL